LVVVNVYDILPASVAFLGAYTSQDDDLATSRWHQTLSPQVCRTLTNYHNCGLPPFVYQTNMYVVVMWIPPDD